jgi:hypothetical protein
VALGIAVSVADNPARRKYRVGPKRESARR